MTTDEDTPQRDFKALREEIATSYDDLSNRLKLIADFTLRDPSGFALRTAAVLGDEIGVAPSAIIRFAKHFGFSRFSELQSVFRDALQASSPPSQDPIRNLEKSGSARYTA